MANFLTCLDLKLDPHGNWKGIVPGPLKKSTSQHALHLEAEGTVLLGPTVRIQPGSSGSLPREESVFNVKCWPCVLYECNAAYNFTYVSENVSELLGLESKELVGNPMLSEQRIPVEDLKVLSSRLAELDHLNTRTSLIHRILDGRGLPFWVAHSLWKANLTNTVTVRGCFVPIDSDSRLVTSEPAIISRFVHKIGNHFQLLNLVVNSLKRTVPESRETVLLQETVEKAIELTRGFSDYNQIPTFLSRIELMEILHAAVMTHGSLFEKRGIAFDSQFHKSLSGVTVQADPYLLELAIGHVLQNALEATEVGGHVTLQARMKCSSAASISVIDSGCGIDDKTLTNVLAPFFTSKKDHEGLGLSMASRFVEMHGGILRIMSTQGKGTEVEIVLPMEAERQSCIL